MYEYLVKYHVFGVPVERTVFAEDEIQAWAQVKATMTTESFWLEDVMILKKSA